MKLGAVLRYYFKNYKSANFYFKGTRSLALSKNVQNKVGYGNARAGLEFPVNTIDNLNIVFSVYWDNDSYSLSKPLLDNEIPDEVTFHGGYGIGIGIQF